MGTTAIFESASWRTMDAAAATRADPAAPLFLFELMDRLSAAVDARDWASAVLAAEALIERTEAGECDPAAPVLMIGWQRYRGIAPEIVSQRFEHLREVLRVAPSLVRDPVRARQRRSAPNAESRAAKIVARLNSEDGSHVSPSEP